MKKKSKISIQIKAFLMRFLCSRKRVDVNLDKVESILVLRYDRIGDMVVTTPLFKALRDRFPEAKISVLASQSNAKIIENNPNINQVYVFPSSLIKRLLLLAKLRAEQFSLLIDLEHNLIWHIIFHIRVINPKWVVSNYKYDRYGIGGRSLSLFDAICSVQPLASMADNYLRIASEELGVKRASRDAEYQLFLSDANNKYAEENLDRFSLSIGLNIFGSDERRKLNIESCVALCKSLLDKSRSIRIIIFSTQKTLLEVQNIKRSVNSDRVVIAQITQNVMDIAALVSKLSLLVTPDTSLVHIGCAFNIPLVAVYPASKGNFAHWRPIHPSNRAKVIFSKNEKSLEGYSYSELKSAVESFL